MDNWTEGAEKPTRLYSASEKKSLVRRLLTNKGKLTWSRVHDDPSVQSEIPSRRTLYRIYQSPDKIKIRDSTAWKIENLLSLLEHHDVKVGPMIALTRTVGASMRQISGTTAKDSHAFLKSHSGCFKCIRFTTNSNEILVTHMRVFAQSGDAVGFVHKEVIPDEASDLPDRPHRIITHRGFVLIQGRLAHFISPFPALRQLTCLISTNQANPVMSGLLLSKDAVWGFPFAARVFASKAEEIDSNDLPTNKDYGLFQPDDDQYGIYLPYIKNEVTAQSVLFPETKI